MRTIYTTHFEKMCEIPDGVNKLIITRYPPKWFKAVKERREWLVLEFAPSPKTLLDFKYDFDWDKYVKRFNKELETNMVDLLDRLINKIDPIRYGYYNADKQFIEKSDIDISSKTIIDRNGNSITFDGIVTNTDGKEGYYNKLGKWEEFQDFCFICFCIGFNHCHRTLLAKYIISKDPNIKHIEI